MYFLHFEDTVTGGGGNYVGAKERERKKEARIARDRVWDESSIPVRIR